ncbi:MAG: GTPase Era [Bacteroidales bacterium]|nr:GTPase Era [Bacteroidales bacterium]
MESENHPKHKAGFVNIVGNPNVGKSTLMNALVGERISIITSKAQTTRHRILGIVNTDDMQIVFSDTPGVLRPVSKLQESMLAFSQSALQDADILLYLTDTVESPEKNEQFLAKVKQLTINNEELTNSGLSSSSPHVIVVLNKMDLVDQDTLVKLVEEWHQRLPDAEIIPISALHGFGTDLLMSKIKELLPECPPYFEKDALTDKPARFFVTEIIREKILLLYDKEIPYSCEVSVESFKEDETIIHISAIIYCERESQKGILIGHKGAMLRRLGTMARKDIEAFFNKKVMLTTFIKVEPNWRNNPRDLNRFGYNPE